VRTGQKLLVALVVTSVTGAKGARAQEDKPQELRSDATQQEKQLPAVGELKFRLFF